METKRIASILVASLVGVGLVVATPTSAVAKTKKLSPAKYAKTVCGALSKVSDQEEVLAEEVSGLSTTDPGTYQTQAAELAASWQQDWAAAAVKFKAAYPDVSNGKKIGKLFTEYAVTGADEIQQAIDKFKAADPNGVAFQADVSLFATSFTTLSTKLGDPVSKVTDQEMLKAFDRERSCNDIFTISGV